VEAVSSSSIAAMTSPRTCRADPHCDAASVRSAAASPDRTSAGSPRLNKSCRISSGSVKSCSDTTDDTMILVCERRNRSRARKRAQRQVPPANQQRVRVPGCRNGTSSGSAAHRDRVRRRRHPGLAPARSRPAADLLAASCARAVRQTSPQSAGRPEAGYLTLLPRVSPASMPRRACGALRPPYPSTQRG
jgi:hypothetical protein